MHEGMVNISYDAIKKWATKLNHKRMVWDTYRGELSNYCEYADKMSALEYVNEVLRGGLRDPALSFELDIGFKFIKIPSSYLHNIHYVNFARFIKWQSTIHRSL